MIRTTRKGMTFGTMVVAGVMILASAAFACTVYKGTMTVTAGGGSSQRTGSGMGMGYCSGTTATSNADVTSGGTFSITVQKFTGSGSTKTCTDQLNIDWYDVNYTTAGATGDCMSSDPASILIQEGDATAKTGLSVDSTGSGSGSFTFPSTSHLGAIGICVSDDGSAEGMQVAADVV